MPVIYRITCKTTRKSYIGQTKHTAHKRWRKHVQKALSNKDKQQCWALNNAIRKYGEDDFIVETLMECDISDLDFFEVEIIEIENTLSPNGYNLTKGGSFRVESWSEESKDKLSESVRKNTTYDLPRNVVEINNPDRKEFGFRVITDSRTYTFIQSSLTMDEKLAIALECYEKIKSGQEFHMINKFKRVKDDLEVPMYIVRRGDNGFAINKKGYTRKTFAHVGNTREQNLQNAIEYLKTL